MSVYFETVEVKGHIIDSLVLPKILDEIINRNGNFEIEEVKIGTRKEDPSYARLRVTAPSKEILDSILRRIQQIGASPVIEANAALVPAEKDGVFPGDFYCTTNLTTLVRIEESWIPVEGIEMDCGIVVHSDRKSASACPIHRVKRGDWVVCGRKGVKVVPLERARTKEVFQFMDSKVSAEKPKSVVIHDIAGEIREIKKSGRKILVVAGPAVVHTGAGKYLAQILDAGWIDVLFAGNGLATHDIEAALFGTSLGVYLSTGRLAKEGHDHHMKAINQIRQVGGIRAAVKKGILTSGIMYTCEKRGVDYVLAGSIRDDGPLPEVITDVLAAQEKMREKIRNVGLALMIASTLHTIATGNLLPATVKTLCVDINPAVVTKVADRGTFQILGLVTDSESFLRELAEALLKEE